MARQDIREVRMTSEPWLPIPYNPAPYECALDETSSQTSSGLTADGVSPSAPVTPAATAGGLTPAGALTFQTDAEEVSRGDGGSRERAATPRLTSPALTFHCAACLLEWEEPFCDWCGATLTPTIDRAARPSSEERPRGPGRKA